MTTTVSILGAGAIGQLLAHKLTDGSIECQFIVNDSAKYVADGWQFTPLAPSAGVATRSFAQTEANEQGMLELVFVCVKAPQLKSALESIKHRLNDHSQLVLFQNGMGHDAIAANYVTESNIFFASNTHGAYRKERQTVVHAGIGSLILGSVAGKPMPDWAQRLIDTNSHHQLHIEWSTDITSVLWRKLMVNAVINPLTAIHRCKNGELLSDEHRPQLLALIDENRRLATALNFEFATSLKQDILQVIERTADNYSSMYQDVTAGRISEIDAINGYLLDQFTKLQILAPHNWALWSQFHIQYPPLKKVAAQKAKQLDELSYYVTQQQGTERPFSGHYYLHNETGVYHCICCGSVLFDDQGKFDSGCGWPSFDRATNNKAIAYRLDTSHNMQRVEILCAQCGAHLGHVFDDGPTETGQRFCVNSVSLSFSPTKRDH